MADHININYLAVKNFGCIKDVTAKLSPIHAFIGPNDSGKSTLLRALRTAMQLLAGHFNGAFPEIKPNKKCQPFHPGNHNNATIAIESKENFNYGIQISEGENLNEKLKMYKGKMKGMPIQHKRQIWAPHLKKSQQPSIRTSLPGITPPRLVRLDPDSMRTPGRLIPSEQQIDLTNEKGIGIASIYDALINRKLDGFLAIRESVVSLFPTVKTIALKNVEASGGMITKELEIELKDGSRVSSQFMSEGLLYYLAFAALKHIDPASILLIEEPENGLHPSRIKDIMSIFREISNETQVLIATHSPLVINELNPDEVTIIWRDDTKGTQALPISETANFKERSKVYALGELWLSYADGINEALLRKAAE